MSLLAALGFGLLFCSSLVDARSSRVKRAETQNCPTPAAPGNGTVDCQFFDELHLDIFCTFTCNGGYKFKGVTDTEFMFICDVTQGFYDTPATPPCVPLCDPPCLHGGTCVAPNKCDCVSPYYGDQCVHSRQLCGDPTPGRFGTMNCQPDGSGGKICKPQCLPTFTFETPPASEYVCGKDGTWSPDVTKIPDCIQETFHPSTTTPRPVVPAVSVSSEAMCAAWGRNHYRTFDNKVYSFDGNCRYVLVHAPNVFEIMLVNDPNCGNGGTCERQVEIYQGGVEIALRKTNGAMGIVWNKQSLSFPGSRDGTVFEKVGNYLTFRSSLGYSIKWDGKLAVFLQISDELKGKIRGLCGKYNGNPTDDLETEAGQLVTSTATFANSWRKTGIDAAQSCPDAVQRTGCPVGDAQATSKCGDILNDVAFTACHQSVDPKPYYDSCKTDCCSDGSGSCNCDALEAYSRACSDKGVKLSWRKSGRCEIGCTGGMVYKECGSPCVRDCSSTNAVCSDNTCIDGCFCPDGQVSHNGQCIPSAQCPCQHNGQDYQQGATIPQLCNTCTCTSGTWDCTRKSCDKTCSATGDPHYQTFDGKRYNFMGNCSYYLMKDTGFSIITDNIKCGHGEASCTKSISVEINGLSIKLDHNHHLFINGREVTTLPYEAPDVKVSMVSSLFMQAVLSNGITILWDGRTRAYIKAPSTFMGKTIGMCGTFDGNQANDFKTLQGNVETIPNAFGNRWKTETSCRDMPTTVEPDPCDVNSQRKAQATALCDKLKSDVFKACQNIEDVQPYYDDCVYDLCACSDNMKDCMCPNIGSYADACAAKGVKINWRLQISECMLACTDGQEYQVCSKPCERTCRDIALNDDPLCNQKCVEGCNCPVGLTLNDANECIPVSQCPCIFDDREYPAGYTTLRDTEICVCDGGQFVCSKISTARVLPTSITSICPTNTEYSDCASNCPVTCENMHNPPTCSQDGCKKGCECLPGFVKDGDQCVNATMCPCRHAGKSYYEGESYTQDCNECVCLSRKWSCSQNSCPATCNAYGDSHYTTFDGRHYEFQGACDYVLVQSTKDSPYNFIITTRNSQCGTSGVTCFKQLEFIVGKEGTTDFYKLQLIKGQSVKPDPGSPFEVKEVGDMIYISTPFGVTLQWDKGTRVYVKVSTDHIQLVEGLCGNFNFDQTDDFTLRQGGPPVVKATEFGDSWKVQSSCAPSQEIQDTCQSSPQRKAWAQAKCSVMNSDLFEPCHSFVDQTQFVKRCEYDACACDFGGDCECLCTAIAAYAHECAVNGVPINWRSNDLCAIQCEDCETYNPCISMCPKKTCENRLVYSQIQKDCEDTQGLCFEGCDLHPCPPGQVYDSLVEPITCIPEALCDTTACEINGKKYREGENVEDDSVCRTECEICLCRNGQLEHIAFGQCEPIPPGSKTPGLPIGPTTAEAVRTTAGASASTTPINVTPKGIVRKRR